MIIPPPAHLPVWGRVRGVHGIIIECPICIPLLAVLSLPRIPEFRMRWRKRPKSRLIYKRTALNPPMVLWMMPPCGSVSRMASLIYWSQSAGTGPCCGSAIFAHPARCRSWGSTWGDWAFLIQFGREEWHSALEQLLKGEYWIENRMMIRAEHGRAGEALGHWHALNEAVVTRASVRPVRLSASVDGMQLTNYVADGLIAATPTGSTAYALAAGGPILPPELRNILLVPIAPHLSVDRAVVLSEGSSVSITLRGGDAVLSVDGQIPIGLAEGDSGGCARRGVHRPVRTLWRPRLLLSQPDRPHEPESFRRISTMIETSTPTYLRQPPWSGNQPALQQMRETHLRQMRRPHSHRLPLQGMRARPAQDFRHSGMVRLPPGVRYRGHPGLSRQSGWPPSSAA